MIGMNPGTKTITSVTADVGVWGQNDLSGSDLAAFLLETTGANNHLTSAITHVRVKTQKYGTIIDVPSAHLRALVEALAPASTIPPAARLRFTVPLSLPAATLRGFEGTVGLPGGSGPSLEVVWDTNASAGTIRPGWVKLPKRPSLMPVWATFQSGVPASQASPTPVPLQTQADELLYGIGFGLVGATGMLTCRLHIEGVGDVIETISQSMLLESVFHFNPQSVATTIFVPLQVPVEAKAGSFLEITTGAGAAAGDIYSLFKLRKV